MKYRNSFLYVLVLVIITIALYGFAIPPAMNAHDTITVLAGIAIAYGWPFVLVGLLWDHFKKVRRKCVKF